MDRDEIDALWSKHVGSRKLSAVAELTTLRKLHEEQILPWRKVYTLYLTSKVWRGMRWRAMQRDKMACVKCGMTTGLQVNHKVYKRIGCESLSDLETVCIHCHRKITKMYDLKTWDNKSKTVDVRGQMYLGARK